MITAASAPPTSTTSTCEKSRTTDVSPTIKSATPSIVFLVSAVSAPLNDAMQLLVSQRRYTTREGRDGSMSEARGAEGPLYVLSTVGVTVWDTDILVSLLGFDR